MFPISGGNSKYHLALETICSAGTVGRSQISGAGVGIAGHGRADLLSGASAGLFAKLLLGIRNRS